MADNNNLSQNQNKPVTLEVIVFEKKATRLAHCMALNRPLAVQKFVPKSEIIKLEFMGEKLGGKTALLTIPSWLAEEKFISVKRDENTIDLFEI